MTPKVLVVDDNEVNREMLEWGLQGRATVHTLTDGSEVLSRVRELQPDLIFLDLMMPDVSGFDVLARLQSEAPALLSRTHIISALTDPQSRARCEAFGVAGYIEKPLDLALIEKLVAEAGDYKIRPDAAAAG